MYEPKASSHGELRSQMFRSNTPEPSKAARMVPDNPSPRSGSIDTHNLPSRSSPAPASHSQLAQPVAERRQVMPGSNRATDLRLSFEDSDGSDSYVSGSVYVPQPRSQFDSRGQPWQGESRFRPPVRPGFVPRYGPPQGAPHPQAPSYRGPPPPGMTQGSPQQGRPMYRPRPQMGNQPSNMGDMPPRHPIDPRQMIRGPRYPPPRFANDQSLSRPMRPMGYPVDPSLSRGPMPGARMLGPDYRYPVDPRFFAPRPYPGEFHPRPGYDRPRPPRPPMPRPARHYDDEYEQDKMSQYGEPR
jgi:hypothetical protein